MRLLWDCRCVGPRRDGVEKFHKQKRVLRGAEFCSLQVEGGTFLLTRGLNQFLFLEPNASDPLNKEAAEDLRTNREGFKRNVRTAMSGGTVKGNTYVRTLK